MIVLGLLMATAALAASAPGQAWSWPLCQAHDGDGTVQLLGGRASLGENPLGEQSSWVLAMLLLFLLLGIALALGGAAGRRWHWRLRDTAAGRMRDFWGYALIQRDSPQQACWPPPQDARSCDWQLLERQRLALSAIGEMRGA